MDETVTTATGLQTAFGAIKGMPVVRHLTPKIMMAFYCHGCQLTPNLGYMAPTYHKKDGVIFTVEPARITCHIIVGLTFALVLGFVRWIFDVVQVKREKFTKS